MLWSIQYNGRGTAQARHLHVTVSQGLGGPYAQLACMHFIYASCTAHSNGRTAAASANKLTTHHVWSDVQFTNGPDRQHIWCVHMHHAHSEHILQFH
jgi:hypothetical protein